MKKFILIVMVAIFAIVNGVSQERKPVIGLTEIGTASGATVEDSNIKNQVRVAFSSAIVNSKRFAVMERSAAELDKIRHENLETDGELNQNTRLDFMLTGEIVAYEKVTSTVDAVITTITTTKTKLVVSVKFTDVKTGQIVLSEVITKEESSQKVTADKIAKDLADELIAKIVKKLYPPIVLSVKQGNIIQTSNANYNFGDVLEVVKNGEELLDPYTGAVIGYDEEVVAELVVFDINETTNIVRAAAEPKTANENSQIEKGYTVRVKMIQKGKNKIVENKKAVATKLKESKK